MTQTYTGQGFIVDFIMSQVMQIKPCIDSASKEVLWQTCHLFLNSVLAYEQCAAVFESCMGCTTPLNILRDILTTNISIRGDILRCSSDDGYIHIQDNRYMTGRKKAKPWTVLEDRKLLAGILHHGIENWSIIAEYFAKTRTRAQCSQRWFRGLDPRISKRQWSNSEDEILLKMVKEHGDTAWAKIAAQLGDRSDVQCRYHYFQMKKQCKKEKIRKGVGKVLMMNPVMREDEGMFEIEQTVPMLPSLNNICESSCQPLLRGGYTLDNFLSHFNR